MKLKIKQLSPYAIIPEFKTGGSAGMDIYADRDIVLLPGGSIQQVGTGLAMSFDSKYECQVRLRSSTAKLGVMLVNGVGTIDSDYRGEVQLLLMNITNQQIVIKQDKAIAQLVFVKIARPTIEVVNDLDNTARGDGGFGSTNKHVGSTFESLQKESYREDSEAYGVRNMRKEDVIALIDKIKKRQKKRADTKLSLAQLKATGYEILDS